MQQAEKSIAGRRVVTRGVKTWKSRVNATMPLVRLQFGGSRLEVPPTWPADNDTSGGAISRDAVPP